MGPVARSSFFSALGGYSQALVKIARCSEGSYKTITFLDPLFDAIGEIAKASNAHPTAIHHLALTRDVLIKTRQMMNMIHFFTCVLPSLFFAGKLLYDLSTKEEISLFPCKPNEQLNYNEMAKNKEEKLLILGLLVSKSIKAAASTSIYLLHFFSHTEFHDKLKMVKYCSGIVGDIFELGYQYKAFQRVSREDYPAEYYLFIKKMKELSCGIIEKNLKLLYEISKTLEGLPPTWFRVPLTLTIASLGLYKLWLKTE